MNRSAARKAAEVAALRRARLAEHEAAVTEAVALYFDRSSRAEQTRVEAQVRADKILADADRGARILQGQADEAVLRLRRLGEPVAEIAAMVAQPVAMVRSVLTAAERRSSAATPVTSAETVPETADRYQVPDAAEQTAGAAVVEPQQAG
ncbi:hypothetical protein [Actinoplanes regularis]|uniref:hypothetical protein n=1 Tax=Actinoplanes regularis TaxID=52697 RepID=UPI0011775649|nr:hypothetical protein [Actinoplanes regularis]